MFVQEKITGSQLGLLLIPLVIATEILSVPATMTGVAKQDAWLAVIPSSVTAFWSVMVMTALANRYPGMTIVEYSTTILGKWMGKLLAIYLAYNFFTFSAGIPRFVIDFLNVVALPKTPPAVLSGVMLVICGIAVFAGIEVIG
ncbi:GerAB/ArcD/ProY family transporter [Effusibacillus consociatus]|uniref:GerAB/ArcD/ProY family transporter n=1 Tax=Effusibacillus consociatus TaxID=1117041 RepID=A0ABV9Q382_9BACL